MRKTIIVFAIAALCTLSLGRAACAAPSAGTQVQAATTSAVPVQMSEDEMSHVVGGQINIPPGQGTPPSPPLSGFIKSLVDQFGVPPGQVGGYNGLANYIRALFPSGSPGLGHLLH